MSERSMFIGLGFQKCATTWLSIRLRRNRQIWYPPINELHFWDRFDRNETEMLEYRKYFDNTMQKLAGNPDRKEMLRLIDNLAYWKTYVTTSPDGEESYRRLFLPQEQHRAFGELDPSYVGLENTTLAKIAGMPETPRVFVIMREPIARIWSQIRHEQRLRPKEVADEESMINYLQSQRLVVQSRYDVLIDRLRLFFPADRIAFFFFEDMVASPELFLRQVCDYIGVEFDERMLRTSGRERERERSPKMPESVRARAVELYGQQALAVRERIGRVPDGWIGG